MTKENVGDDFKWIVQMSGIDGHTSTGVQLVIGDCDENPMFLIGWSPGDSTESPIYKEYNGGWGEATTDLPAGMSVSGNYNEDYYEIVIPKDAVSEGDKYCWAINVEATAPGVIGEETESVQQHFPADWGRWNAPTENCYCETIERTDEKPYRGGMGMDTDVPTASSIFTVAFIGMSLLVFMRFRKDE
ncbi:hypothetical protein Mzhil_1076 [Methanosalsum zhilinae DSM 4017]|uniref:Uncharacterized protein n=1 Tax=Methanosalsum zhilinae (strain DSM 4017 / NBRC 107636 / OCM 62 / WeN5) TaxID=679901 RepID=F7XM01_METZD|nr:hypothetical protein [Methanosalsum zhilinae]AEH60932.1 hypothetical protein Mzhil_1076 [Methanosalsum zhilinae DSM 4017]